MSTSESSTPQASTIIERSSTSTMFRPQQTTDDIQTGKSSTLSEIPLTSSVVTSLQETESTGNFKLYISFPPMIYSVDIFFRILHPSNYIWFSK